MYKSCISIKLNDEIGRTTLSEMIRGELTNFRYSQYSSIYESPKIIKPDENIMTFFIHPNVLAMSLLNQMLMEFCDINRHHCELVELRRFSPAGLVNSPLATIDERSFLNVVFR